MSRAQSHGHSHPGHSHPPGTHHDEHHHPGLTVAVEKKKGLAEVQVTITEEELERVRVSEYAALSKRVSLKGFRPGKTPRAMLERQFKVDVEKSVIEHFMQHAYQKAVEEHGLRPAAFPRIPVGDNVPKKGEPWSLSFELLLRPEVTLGQVDGLEVQGRPITVGEDELDRALTEIRRANSRAEPAGDEGLTAEGMAVATIDFFRPGSEASVLTREGIRLSPASPPSGFDAAAFAAALIGARAGEQRTLDMELPANFPVEAARGERGRVRFSLQEVLRVVPPSDEEVFKAFEVSDQAGLREALRARMLTGKAEAEDQRIEHELLERLIEAHPMELPARLIEDQVQASQSELRAELAKQGLSEEEAQARAASDSERSRASAEKALKAVYLIEEIARSRELQVNQEDLSAELSAIAERNGTPVTEVARYYKEEGLLRQLGLELLERKVRRYLRTTAAIRRPAT